MEILAAIVGAVAEYTVGPIIRQGGYIIHCKRNIRTLQTRVEDLKAAKGRVDVEIDEADRKGEHIYPDVQQWIAKVDEIAGKADELLKDEPQAKMNCMHGFCPNLLTRHQLSRKSTKLVEVVLEFQGKANFPSISYGGRTEVVFLTPTKDYEAFDSRSLTLNRIMDELKNPDINKIGVYGIAGVGKTTLAEEVVRQVLKDKLFDDVVIVRDVKEYPDIERIQKEIAEQLGMDNSNVFKDLSRTEKARRIYDRLKNKQTFLVLDDIWNFFDLKVVGLPDVATCKILLTSRSGEVLCTQMGTQKEFQLAALEEQECWSLFESKVGDVVRDPMILTVATQVAKKCGGLPILVVTVASALKKCTLPEWEDALRRLETFQNTGSIKQAFSALEWIYDKLDDEELQSLFLLCGVATWENSIFLDDLLKLAVGLDLLKGVNTMKEARNSLLSLVKKLKNFCLLLDDNGDTSVRMHDLVNDVAKEIASRDQQLLSIACGAELKDWPKTSKCGKISIKSDSLAKLSEVLVCQKLEMFHLHCEDKQPLQVPNGLFTNMEKLKVLSLCMVKNLASLGFLKNLQTLCLDRCEVGDIAVVGELRKLEILSLGNTYMKQLPEEIGELTSLRLLDLTSCFSLEVIAPNVLSRLTRLEDLRMRYSSIKWEAEHEGERSNASLSELKHLSLLTALEVQISNPHMLPKDLFSDKLERFHICIGDHSWGGGWSMNTLKLQFTTGDELDQGLKMLMKRSEYLTLEGGANVNETAYRLEGDNFRQLKLLQLRKLDTTYIINSKVVFSSLTTLEVTNCDGIKFLFSSSMARSLIQLKTLTISRCRSMVVIVSTQEDDEENNIVNMFSKLESLTLRELPSLVGFCSGSYAGFSSLEEALISNGQSKSTTITKEIEDGDSKDHLGVDNAVHYFLFDEKVTFPSLERLRLEELPKLEAVWHNQLAPDSFCRIIKVRVDSCPSLIALFVPCIMERLDALKTLRVWSCPLLEVVFKCGRLKFKETHDPSTKELKIFNCCPNLEKFSIQRSDGLKYIFQTEERLETVPKFVFPKVTKLLLLNLPQFKSIYPGTHVSQWPSLQELNVDKCGEVEIIAGELSVYQEKQESPSHSNPIGQPLILVEKVVFSRLTTLEVTDFHGIKFLFSPSMARSLVQLRTLTISRCRSMVVIVSTQEDDEENNIVNMFSKLESLTLRELPSLVGFCSGSYVGFSSLEEALISNGQSKTTTITKEIEDGDSKDHLGVDNAVHYFLFDEKVAFPSLEILRLEELPKLEAVWQNQLAPNSFWRLKEVGVLICSSLINLFVPCITEKLDALETLTVWSCPSLEVVFKCGGLKFKETHDPSTQELKTFNCCPNLEKFSIRRSDGLKYIFQTEERLETLPKFVFPKVTKLLLLNLPQFKSIYPGTHVSQWPSLQELNVDKCGEVEIIAGELSVYQEKQESPSHSNPIGQPLILVEKVVFSSLTTLEVTDFHGIKFLFSPSMARSLVQLRNLTISRCRSMVVIVSTQEDDEENNIVNMFSKLESLTLRELPSFVGFCSGSYAGFSSLEEALISNGQSKSTTITKEIEDGDSKDHLGVDNAVHYFLFDEKVTFPSLEILRLEKLPKLEAVWQNQLAPNSFWRLKEVGVLICSSLINLFVSCITERLDALETLTVWSCPSLEVVFKCGGLKFKETHDPSTKELKTFNCCPNLEKFSIRRSDGLKYIFKTEERLGTVPKFVFPKVTKLLLLNLPQFKSIYPGTHVSQWPSLQELNLDKCGEVEIIAGELSVYQEKQESPSHSYPIGQPLILVEKVVFSSLTTLEVTDFHGIKFLFSLAMARSLVQLRTLTISRCRSMVVIVSTQEDDEENNIVNIYSKLESLTLRELPSFVGFCSGSYAEFSSLEEALISNGQSKSTTMTKEIEDGDSKDHLGVDNAIHYFLFDEKVTFPSLERLRLEELPKLEAVWHNQLAPDSFCRIIKVRVDRCPSLIALFVPCIMERLDALKTLRVWSCPLLEVVFKCGRLKFKETHDPSTKELKTFNCCPNLEKFSIQRSDGLKYIFQTEERLETVPKFVFPKVTKLLLLNLPQFKSIYPGTHVSQWPSLQELNVDKCGEVEIIAGELSVYQEKQESPSYSNPIGQPLILVEKVMFSSLTTLEVTDFHGIKFLFSPSMARSLVQLRTLTISRCRSMVVIVSTQEDDEENNIVNIFSKLESLTLRELPSLVGFCSGSYARFSSLEEALISNGQSKSTTSTKEIEDGDSKDHLGVDNAVHYFLFDEKVTFPSLEILRLEKLPKLEAVWQNQLAPNSFCRIIKVRVDSCPSLIALFVPCIMKRLDALKTLRVWSCPLLEVVFKCGRLKFKETHDPSTKELKTFNCCPNLEKISIQRSDGLKYIFQTEKRLETVPKFVFPKVTKLLLLNLPQFKSIYPGTHVSQWPSLQELNVDKCGEVEIIAGELSVYQEKQESPSHSNPIGQPLILVEKGSSLFPSLETLTLGPMELWSGPPPAQFCSKVKLVEVSGATFSKHATFLQGLHNLEKIIVTDMGDRDPCREIFVDAGNGGGEIQVRKLTIRDMDELMHIGKESSQSAVPVFPKLEKLWVRYCSRLKNLDSSTISFQNLTSLTVDSLDGLKYLVSHRIARSLMQLTRLKIRYCERMEVIVATEEDDELAFSQLKHLELRWLPHLRGLCSGNCILKFPSLETLSINRRLKSKLFSHDEIRCKLDYNHYDIDVEDAPADDEDGGVDNEVNDDGHGNDKKDDEESACDA